MGSLISNFVLRRLRISTDLWEPKVALEEEEALWQGGEKWWGG